VTACYIQCIKDVPILLIDNMKIAARSNIYAKKRKQLTKPVINFFLFTVTNEKFVAVMFHFYSMCEKRTRNHCQSLRSWMQTGFKCHLLEKIIHISFFRKDILISLIYCDIVEFVVSGWATSDRIGTSRSLLPLPKCYSVNDKIHIGCLDVD